MRRVDAVTGSITAVAGTGEFGSSNDPGPAINAKLKNPQAVAVDATRNIYIADFMNRKVRKIDGSGTITTVVGTGDNTGFLDDGCPATDARLATFRGIVLGNRGNLWIAERESPRSLR